MKSSFGLQSTSCINNVKAPLVPARSTSWLAHTGPSAQIWHSPPCRTCHSLSRSCATWTCWNPNMSCLATSPTLCMERGGNLPTYNITAVIWAEHNPNSTNPGCFCHTHLCWSNLSFLHLSCKNSQENMSASPCSSNVMFFHLLMLLCACTNLNVMIEILQKTLSFSEHLKQTALVRPPSTSWTTSKRNCVILNWTCWLPQPSTSHILTSCKTAFHRRGLPRLHNFSKFLYNNLYNTWKLSSSWQRSLTIPSWLFHRLLDDSFQDGQFMSTLHDSPRHSETQFLVLLMYPNQRIPPTTPCSDLSLLGPLNTRLLLTKANVSSTATRKTNLCVTSLTNVLWPLFES